MTKRKYDSTVARIAGNIASGFISNGMHRIDANWMTAKWSVELARAIVAETERTEPVETIDPNQKF